MSEGHRSHFLLYQILILMVLTLMVQIEIVAPNEITPEIVAYYFATRNKYRIQSEALWLKIDNSREQDPYCLNFQKQGEARPGRNSEWNQILAFSPEED